MRKPIIGGNWKLKINTRDQATNVFSKINDFCSSLDKVDSFLAVPYVLLPEISAKISVKHTRLGAQNMAYDTSGALTGEISIESLKEVGVEYVLIGHSERRIIFKESLDDIAKKVKLCLKWGLKPVLCIGETAQERNDGKFEQVISDQLSSALEGIGEGELGDLVVAYEPVWAINNPLLNPNTEIKAASSQEAADAHKFVRNWLVGRFSSTFAEKTRIQYGGSMNKSNANELLAIDDIDGGLIGSASVSLEDFQPILEAAINQKYSS